VVRCLLQSPDWKGGRAGGRAGGRGKRYLWIIIFGVELEPAEVGDCGTHFKGRQQGFAFVAEEGEEGGREKGREGDEVGGGRSNSKDVKSEWRSEKREEGREGGERGRRGRALDC